MDLIRGAWGEALLRSAHIATGILWIGCVIVFALVSVRDAKSPVEETTIVSKLTSSVPSLSRWGAATTWLTGMLLTVLVYYGARDQLVRREVRLETRHGLTVDFVRATEEPVIGHATGVMISLGVIALSFLAYGAVWKFFRPHARIAAAGSYLLFVLVLYLLSQFFTGRAVLMHAGALLGTAMAVNVWARRGLARSELIHRARDNACMSLPAILAMIATQDAAIRDRSDGWVVMALVVAVSWAATAWAVGRGRFADTGRSPRRLDGTEDPRA